METSPADQQTDRETVTGRTDEELLADLRTLIDQTPEADRSKDGKVSRQKVMDRFGVGAGRASRLLSHIPARPVLRAVRPDEKRPVTPAVKPVRKPQPTAVVWPTEDPEAIPTAIPERVAPTGDPAPVGAADQQKLIDRPVLTDRPTAEVEMTADRSEVEVSTGRPINPWPVLLLALPAFVAIWGGWVGLGKMTGFGPVDLLPGIHKGWVVNTSITLPIGVETYAAVALHTWLSDRVRSVRTRAFAKWSAIGSLAVGMFGQVVYHLLKAAEVEKAPWGITTFVACLPVVVLGLGAALFHMLGEEK